MEFDVLENNIVQIEPLIRGSNREQRFNLYQSVQNGQVFTGLTGASIIFSLKRDVDGPDILVKKNEQAGGDDNQILILDDSSFAVYFDYNDTQDLRVFNYKGIITITTVTDKIYKKYLDIPII